MSKPIKPKTIRPHHAILFIVLILSVSFFLIIGSIITSRRLIDIGKSSVDAVVPGNANQPITNGVMEFNVSSVRVAAEIPSYFELPEGHKAICVALTLKNISGSEQKFIPVNEVRLKTAKDVYPIDVVPTCGGIGGPIQTGEILSGELGFIVAEREADFTFRYDPVDNVVKSVEIEGLKLNEQN